MPVLQGAGTLPKRPDPRTQAPSPLNMPEHPGHPDLLWMGLMSGTSTDGVDGVIARFSDLSTCSVLASASLPFPDPLKGRLLALQRLGWAEEAPDPLLELEQGINGLTDVYCECANLLMGQLPSASRPLLRAAGAHGQTLRHRPDLGVTLQHFNPARFHVRTGLSVVSDFRRADVALGGQGAPLVPAFHQWWINGLRASAGHDSDAAGVDGVVVVLNVGGFANLSCISGNHVIGFDSGPGNVLMDAWIRHQRGEDFDADGNWAASGQVHAGLLRQLLAHPFFARPLPRSTGRDDFHLEWLLSLLQKNPGIAAADVQATLLALTVRSIADCVPDGCRRLLVCGGGACNAALMSGLARALPDAKVEVTDVLGVPASQMEAIAFAWLARQRLCGLPGNLPAVTGASASVVLGSLTGL